MKCSMSCNIRSYLQLNVIVMIIVLAAVWGLLSLPILFFYLPTDDINVNSQCSFAIETNHSVCHEVLLLVSVQNISASPQRLAVVQNTSEDIEELLDEILRFASSKCEDALVSFLCLYYYGGVCDKNGEVILTSVNECLNISTGVCKGLWSMPELGLPQCEKSFQSTNETSDGVLCPLSCTDGFFCDSKTGTCVPDCPDWNFFPSGAVRFGDILVLLVSVLGAICGVCVIIISCIRRQTVYTFPSVLVVYETISMLILVLLQIITFFNREYLYCTSQNLLEAARSSSPYCIISGMVQVAYIPLQFNIWWVTHMWVLYWTVSHPFEVKKSSTKKMFKRAHAAITIIGILIPIIPIVAVVVYDVIQPYEYGTIGFGFLFTPPLFCSTTNPASFFYFIMLPNAVFTLIGITGLALTIWTIHKKYGIIDSIRNNKNSSFSTAEKKLLVVIFYFILIEAVYFTGSSQTPEVIREIELYVMCEETGVDPNNPCSRSEFENPNGLLFFLIFYSLSLLIPVVNFLFVVDFGALKRSISKLTIIHQS